MYSLNEVNYYYDEADGIGILIDFTTGVYYSLNKIGTAVFSRLRQGASTEQIEEKLKELPGYTDEVHQYLGDFISLLLEKRIIQNDEALAPSCEAFAEHDVEEGFQPIADEFSEVQDIIMADPVHDVNEDLGWPHMKQ